MFKRSLPTVVAIAHADKSQVVAEILEKWAQELIKCAAMRYTVINICGDNLTYERMTKILQVTKPSILFYLGPGNKAHLIGNDMKPVLTCCPDAGVPDNLQSVAGMAVIAYSSLAEQQLGPEIIKAGSPCFVGFSDQLIIVSDKHGSENIFKESLLPLAKRILRGWTVGAAVEQTRSDLLAAVMERRDNEFISISLFANRKGLKYLGNPNWKLKGGN